MADPVLKPISTLTELTAGNTATDDLFVIVDVSATPESARTKKIQLGSLKIYTAEQLSSNIVETAKILDGAVTVAKISGLSSNPDPNADRIIFWDDSAGALTWLTVGSGLSLSGTTLSTAAAAEKAQVYLKILGDTEPWSVGDGKIYWTVPSQMNAWNLTDAQGYCISAGTAGIPEVQVARGRRSTPNGTPTWVDMLSTKLTWDAGEYSTTDAATQRVINTSNDDIATRDVIRIDIDGIGTGTAPKGLDILLEFTA